MASFSPDVTSPPTETATGRSSFEIQGSPAQIATPQRELEEAETARSWINYIPARPRQKLTQPEYPRAARNDGVGPCVLFVTVTFDETGKAVAIHPSEGRVAPLHEHADAFIAAATQTLNSWDIEPAREVYWSRNDAGEEIYQRTVPVAETMETKFTFTP